MNDANAQITTTASMMFQNSLRYEPGCKITPKSIIYIQIRKSVSGQVTGLRNRCFARKSYLQDHFDGKDHGEHIVDYV